MASTPSFHGNSLLVPKDLTAAYRQLPLYREDLENPPLLVVCDLDRLPPVLSQQALVQVLRRGGQ